MRTRNPRSLGLKHAVKEAGAMCDAKEGRWQVSYGTALVPITLVAFSYVKGPVSAHGNLRRADDVPLAKLNDYQLGGCTSL